MRKSELVSPPRMRTIDAASSESKMTTQRFDSTFCSHEELVVQNVIRMTNELQGSIEKVHITKDWLTERTAKWKKIDWMRSMKCENVPKKKEDRGERISLTNCLLEEKSHAIV